MGNDSEAWRMLLLEGVGMVSVSANLSLPRDNQQLYTLCRPDARFSKTVHFVQIAESADPELLSHDMVIFAVWTPASLYL